jgi:NMD protein affecting ribosome stability and mRNA decay
MKGKARLRVQDRNGQPVNDPYYNQNSPQDRSYCKKCHAIFHHKHWHFDNNEIEKLKKTQTKVVLCPACQKIADKFASGVITLRGDFVRNHREEIVNLIRNEEKRASGLNPLERIIEIHASARGMEVTTTHEKLAQRIGKRLHRAFRGDVTYQWTPQDKMARVQWNRP